MRGGPAGADAHHGMRVVGLLGKAELDLALQTVDSRLIHRHENLVGGRFESERVALGSTQIRGGVCLHPEKRDTYISSTSFRKYG